MNIAGRVPLSLRRKAYSVLPAPVWSSAKRFALGQTVPQITLRRARTAAHHRMTGWSSAETVGLRVGNQTYIARRADAFSSSAALGHHLELVADALQKHDVPYFVLDAQSERRRVVVVAHEERQKALSALARELRHSPTYIAPVAASRVESPRLLGHSPLPRSAMVFRVFEVLASPSGGFLGGPGLGVELEFWRRVDHSTPAEHNGEPVPAGTLIAPRRNPWADLIIPSEQQTTLRTVDGTPRPVLSTIDRPHLFTVTQPVDLVYTWVDGSDPDWILRKAAAQHEHVTRSSVMHALAANDSRFMSRDELRYSLRSVDMYADWVRQVYLVTDDQVPAWLDTDNPRITVVSHRELFGDRGRLPTFNSHAIESQLHRIEGLSENYLYMNDDVFFGRPVSPDLFFHGNGLAKFFTSHAKIGLGPAGPGDMPVMSAAKNNRDLIAKLFDRTVSNKFKHVPHALRRSVMADLEADLSADFERTAASQFRSHEDISVSASLGHYYGYATGRSVPGRIRYFYADIARDNTPQRLKSLLWDRNFDVFCLNDHDSSTIDPVVQARLMSEFLEAYFPQSSSFEIDLD